MVDDSDNDEIQAVTPTTAAPPLRINRISLKSLDNFRAKGIMFNGRTDTLLWLRAQIERVHSIPSQFQRITIGTRVLQGREDRLLPYCNVHDESLLRLSTRAL